MECTSRAYRIDFRNIELPKATLANELCDGRGVRAEERQQYVGDTTHSKTGTARAAEKTLPSHICAGNVPVSPSGVEVVWDDPRIEDEDRGAPTDTAVALFVVMAVPNRADCGQDAKAEACLKGPCSSIKHHQRVVFGAVLSPVARARAREAR
jgi:hypothetical protein